MQNDRFTVRRVGDIYVISDDGRIAKTLGLGDTEWHLVAPRAELIADRIERMADLIANATSSRGIGEAVVAGDPCPTTTATTATAPTAIQFHIPTRGSAADLPIDALELKPDVRRRLKNRGITSIGQLVGYSAEELLSLHRIGAGVVSAVESALGAVGYRLKRRIT